MRPWGFELDSVRVPVSVWHGKLDLFVPYTHSIWLAAHLPTSELHQFDFEGHLSVFERRVLPLSWIGCSLDERRLARPRRKSAHRSGRTAKAGRFPDAERESWPTPSLVSRITGSAVTPRTGGRGHAHSARQFESIGKCDYAPRTRADRDPQGPFPHRQG